MSFPGTSNLSVPTANRPVKKITKIKIQFKFPGCKENHFYILPFRQAEAYINQPDIISTGPQNFLTSRIGHLHHDIILLLQAESFRVLLSCASQGFCHLILTGITKFKYGRQNEKDSGHSSKMTLSCKWPIDFTVLLLFEFLKKNHLPIEQDKNRVHQPDSKIHQPQAIGHYFLCKLLPLTLSKPKCLMEFCKVTLTFDESADKIL